MLKRWYIFKLTVHEWFCKTSLYTVFKDDNFCLVIHDHCGKTWTSGRWA